MKIEFNSIEDVKEFARIIANEINKPKPQQPVLGDVGLERNPFWDSITGVYTPNREKYEEQLYKGLKGSKEIKKDEPVKFQTMQAYLKSCVDKQEDITIDKVKKLFRRKTRTQISNAICHFNKSNGNVLEIKYFKPCKGTWLFREDKRGGKSNES